MDKKREWWQRPAYITAIATLLGLIAPATVALNQYFNYQSVKQTRQHEIGIKFLDRAIAPKQEAEYKESVLDFIVHMTNPEDKLHKWAADRQQKISDVVDLKNQRDELLKNLEIKNQEILKLTTNKGSEKNAYALLTLKEKKQATIEQLKSLNDSLKTAERQAYSKGSYVSGGDYQGDVWLPNLDIS